MAQIEVAAHALAAQVQITVTQAQLFAHLFVIMHRNRKGQIAAGGIEHLQVLGQHLNLTGGQALVAGFIGTRPHPSLHLQHRFIAQVLSNSKRFGPHIRVHRDLHGATAVAQINKDHPAMVARGGGMLTPAAGRRDASPQQPVPDGRESPP